MVAMMVLVISGEGVGGCRTQPCCELPHQLVPHEPCALVGSLERGTVRGDHQPAIGHDHLVVAKAGRQRPWCDCWQPVG
ncbi:hypothetical protein [Kibdelosporangium philippinense]|uniref:hypothetical protein n=1 Tax=Kibdelosporangium philippinense TaxID=211113 RepID=UPI00361A922A